MQSASFFCYSCESPSDETADSCFRTNDSLAKRIVAKSPYARYSAAHEQQDFSIRIIMKIAYIMSRFPKLSETFILREMNELKRQGYRIELYPLILQKEAVIHAEAAPWIPRMQYSRFISPDVLTLNQRAFVRNPRRYGELWKRVLRENRTFPKFLIRSALLFPKIVHMADQMQMRGIQHIHAHFATYPALAAWIIHKLTGIPFSVTVHAHDIFVRKEMLATKLRDAAFIVAISDYNRDYLIRSVGAWTAPKTRVIHCGIPAENYTPLSGPRQQDRFEIISIGSLEPYKGHPYLIDACAMLRERNILFRCRIIGGGKDRAVLEKMIRGKNLAREIELLGPRSQEEIARLLPAAHCYVQPSIITQDGKMEGIPVSIMEAMACNLPVAASDISGIPELVKPGRTGYLVPPGNASALADVLTRIYKNPEEAFQLARNGRSLVLEEFELRANTRRLFELIIETSDLKFGKNTANRQTWA
jgi:glycosyltransferase involved in cell wall biosynthesis